MPLAELPAPSMLGAEIVLVHRCSPPGSTRDHALSATINTSDNIVQYNMQIF